MPTLPGIPPYTDEVAVDEAGKSEDECAGNRDEGGSADAALDGLGASFAYFIAVWPLRDDSSS